MNVTVVLKCGYFFEIQNVQPATFLETVEQAILDEEETLKSSEGFFPFLIRVDEIAAVHPSK